MKNTLNLKKYFRYSLLIVGIMICIIAPLHGIWHWFFPAYPEMQGLTQIQRDIFNLFNWAITFFLLFMAVLTIIIALAKSVSLFHLKIYSILLILFWISRLLLEYIFKVQIPFVIIREPTAVLKLLMFIGLGILIVPHLLNIIIK